MIYLRLQPSCSLSMDVLVVPETQDGHNSCVFLSSVCYMSVALFLFQQTINLLIWLFIELYRHKLSWMSWWSHFEVSTAWVWKILIIPLLVHIHWTPNFSSITRQHSIQKVLMFACLAHQIKVVGEGKWERWKCCCGGHCSWLYLALFATLSVSCMHR